MLDILVVAPHPDDAELGMAGTIMRAKDEGLRVGILDLTSGEPTPHGSPEIRARETAAATEILNVDWRENLGLVNRKLEHTLAARAQLANVFRRVRPRLIFAPYWVDSHPDHVAATDLIEAAQLLVEAHQERTRGRALFSVADSLLLLRALAHRHAAGLRDRHQRLLGAEAGIHRVLPQPVHRRA